MDVLISDDAQAVIVFVLYVGLAGIISLCGLAANSINIVVFTRQGLQDSASVCLLLLSMWDLGVCLTTLLYALSFATDRLAPPGDISLYDLSLLVSSLPRMFFAELSMCTTVVMSMERCLCVAKPLTFKNFINRKNTIIVFGFLYTEVAASNLSQFCNYPMAWQWDSTINATRFKLVLKNGPESLSSTVHYLLNNATLTIAAMSIVIVCTCVMVSGLKASGRFRQTVKSTTRQNLTATSIPATTPAISAKEARLVKMVTLVSIIFLACNAPVMATLVAKKLVPDLNMYGRYQNLNDILWAFLYFTAAVNATLTICVYLKISTNYRTQIAKLFSIYSHAVPKKTVPG